jgi:putative restriction endonuclease
VDEKNPSRQLLLQPRGGPADNGPRNFALAVGKGIHLVDRRELFDADLTALREVFPEGVARLWGNTPPKNESSLKAVAIRKRRVGDRLMFYAERHFIAEATIAHLFRNVRAAESIWGKDSKGQTFEHMMALADVRVYDSPHPAVDAVRRVTNQEFLRSLTLVPEFKHRELTPFLPPDRGSSLAVGSSKTSGMTAAEMVRLVVALPGSPAELRLAQALALLWAIAQRASGSSRLHTWADFRRGTGPLLEDFGCPIDVPFRPRPPSGFWEVHGVDPAVAPIRGIADEARAGFTEEAFGLLGSVPRRTKVINAIRAAHLGAVANHDDLLKRIGLSDYATATGGEGASSQSKGPAPRTTVSRSEIDRDRRAVKEVKALHDDRCQFCETQLTVGQGFYSEAAHIQGLGKPHDGPDDLSNLLCLCANCHVQFDKFGIYIDEQDVVRQTRDQAKLGELRRNRGHRIDDERIRYHQSLCYIPGCDGHGE